MNWIIVLFVVLVISVILIIMALVSLPQVGDERKNLIKMKAQSYTFAAVIAYVLLQTFKNIYAIFQENGTYDGINPFTFLVAISIAYLGTLLFFKKKYGG